MTGYHSDPIEDRRLAALAARAHALDERDAVLKTRMRAVGYPVREDYSSRTAYRTAVAEFRRGTTNARG